MLSSVRSMSVGSEALRYMGGLSNDKAGGSMYVHQYTRIKSHELYPRTQLPRLSYRIRSLICRPTRDSWPTC